MSTKAPETVSFRLPDFIDRLQHEAKIRDESVGECARRLVVEALNNTDHAELRHDLAELRAEVRRGREDVASLALGLLVTVGGQSPEKARAWVAQNLTRPVSGASV